MIPPKVPQNHDENSRLFWTFEVLLTKFEKGIPWTSHTLYAVLRGQGYNKKTQDLNDKRLDWEDVFYYSNFWGKGDALVVLTCADIIWEITRPTQICSTFRWCNSLVTIHLNIWECRKGDATKRERNMGLFPTRPLRDTPSWLKKSLFHVFSTLLISTLKQNRWSRNKPPPPFPTQEISTKNCSKDAFHPSNFPSDNHFSRRNSERASVEHLSETNKVWVCTALSVNLNELKRFGEPDSHKTNWYFAHMPHKPISMLHLQ